MTAPKLTEAQLDRAFWFIEQLRDKLLVRIDVDVADEANVSEMAAALLCDEAGKFLRRHIAGRAALKEES